MKRVILYLRCPDCGGDFRDEEEKIVCIGCGKSANIYRGKIFCFEVSEPPKNVLEKTMYGPEQQELEKEISNKESSRLMFKKFISKRDDDICCLDYGCGSSRQILDLANEYPGGIIFGLDYDLAPLEIAAGVADSRGYKNIFLIQQKSPKLPFKEEIFDVVTSHQVLEHVPEPEKAVREISRVMKREGIFEVDFPNGNSPGETARNIFHKMTNTKNPHISRIGLKKAKKIFRDAGFQPEYFQSVQALTGPLSYLIEGLIFRYMMKKSKIWSLREKYQTNFLFRFLKKVEKIIGDRFPGAGHAFIFILRKI